MSQHGKLSNAIQRHQRWALDLGHDPLLDGRQLRVVGVMDHYSQECLLFSVDTSISGGRVARELDSLISKYGKPVQIGSDNGSEFTSKPIRQ